MPRLDAQDIGEMSAVLDPDVGVLIINGRKFKTRPLQSKSGVIMGYSPSRPVCQTAARASVVRVFELEDHTRTRIVALDISA